MEIKIEIAKYSNAKSEPDEIVKSFDISKSDPISFANLMKELGIVFCMPCGGAKKCLRCAIRFLYGVPDIQDADADAFDFSELKNGWRLACHSMIKADCKIHVPVQLVSNVISTKEFVNEEKNTYDSIGVAVDIGTTTIAIAYVDMETKQVICTRSYTNPQIAYGADVMSRISAAVGGAQLDIYENINSFLLDKIENQLKQINHNTTGRIKVFFAGNTTMMHLFLNYSVEGLGAYPFKPVRLSYEKKTVKNFELNFVPGISAYVGSDIVSGLFSLREQVTWGINLLIDLGTNAEIVLIKENTYYATSAPCGPALEGGNLSCGVASVDGAINHVHIDENAQVCFTTINGSKPVGICGSGILDVVAQLWKNGIIDEGGLLEESYADTGFELTDGIVVAPEDVQQVLLAKSAIYTAIKLLLERAEVTTEDINNVFLSGGMGDSVSVDSLVQIQAIPSGLEKKCCPCGNTSLNGAISSLINEDELACDSIIKNSVVLELANEPSFQNEFLNNLLLPKR